MNQLYNYVLSRAFKRGALACALSTLCLVAWLTGRVVAVTRHAAISRYESLTGAQNGVTSVTGETVLMVGRVDSGPWFLRVVTLDPVNGARKGAEFQSTLPQGTCYPANPVKTFYSKYFLPGNAVIVGGGFQIGVLPITVQSTGTPAGGSWSCLATGVDSALAGRLKTVAEIIGTGFSDGRARFFVGTETGFVLEFVRNQQGSILLNGQYDMGGSLPISDLGPVPQAAGIALGVASGQRLSGWRVGSGAPQLLFRLTHPTGSSVKAFRTFEPGDQRPTAGSEVHIAFCDGKSDHVFYTAIPATLYGDQPLDVHLVPPTFDTPPAGSKLPFTGSLLLLYGQQGQVRYRPGYLDGASANGCMVKVSDATWLPCTPCPIVVTGDVENSGSIAAADVIRLVGFVFKGGVAPEPCRASGDVDCSGFVNASDVIAIVNYVFKSGKAPCNVCTLFAGAWTCP